MGMLCLLSVASWRDGSAQTLQDVYRSLKSLEGRIPLPTPQATVGVVGPFINLGRDAEHPNRPGRPVPVIHRDLPLTADAVNVVLRFRREDVADPFLVQVGHGAAVPAGSRTFVDVPIGRAREVAYTVRTAYTRYQGSITISRPPVIGLGVFVTPPFP